MVHSVTLSGRILTPCGTQFDHPFDQGYISFSNTEQLIVVPEVRAGLLDKWGTDAGTGVGTFDREQRAFQNWMASKHGYFAAPAFSCTTPLVSSPRVRYRSKGDTP